MAKLVLTPNPTFVVSAEIHTPGGKPAAVKFTFNHMDADTYDEFSKVFDENRSKESGDKTKKTIGEAFLPLVSGWDLEPDFNAENLTLLCQKYWSTPSVIFKTYLAEMMGARQGN